MASLWQAILPILLLCGSRGSKILLLPVDHQGHVNFFVISGQAISALGHEVYVLTTAKHRQKVLDAGLKSITHTPSSAALTTADDKEAAQILQSMVTEGEGVVWSTKVPKLLGLFTHKSAMQCEEILQDEAVNGEIEEVDFDLAVVDSFLLSRCLLTVAYKHSLRYVTLSDGWTDSWEVRVPAMLSVEPLPMTRFTNQMSFLQRLGNIFAFFISGLVRPMLNVEPDYLVEKYVPNRPKVSLADLHRKAELFLINLEILLMDYPRVSAPHFKYVGSMGGSPPKPLDKELEEFVSSAKEGIILVSFGSMFRQVPEEFLEKLSTVASFLPERKFIIKSETNTTNSDNIKTMKWLPQNDLLGHENVKLFITHGGSNGQLEGLYHGVPMVVAPLFGDQPYNAARVEHRKYGSVINMMNDSPQKITKIIKEVLENPVYAQNIKKASEIYKALPKANETIAYWVDHILKFGSDHIRPSYIDMPLYQFFMLDILVFLITILLVLCFVLYKFCICCVSCAKKLNKSKTE